MGLAELLRRIGDEHVSLEPVEANVQGAKLVAKGKLTELRLLTSQTNPTQIMALVNGRPLPKVGLVIWFDRARYEKALADHNTERAK